MNPGRVAYVRLPDGTAAEFQAATIVTILVLAGDREPAEIVAGILGRGCIPVLDVDFDGSYLIRSAIRAHFVAYTSKGGSA